MHSKSQVTIFMILGLVMMFSFIIVFYATSQSKSQLEYAIANEAKLFVQSCLELMGEQAIGTVLVQGGTYKAGTFLGNPKIYILAETIDVGGNRETIKTSNQFSKDSFKIGIKNYFEDVFDICINNFQDIKQEIEFNNYKFDVAVEENVVVFNLNYPITITDGENRRFLDRFVYSKRMNIGLIERVVNQIVDESVNLNDVPLDLLGSFTRDNVISSLEMTVIQGQTILDAVIYFLGFDENRAVFAINYN